MTKSGAISELLAIHYILPLQVLLMCLRNQINCDLLFDDLSEGTDPCTLRTKRKLELYLNDLNASDRAAVIQDIGARFWSLVTQASTISKEGKKAINSTCNPGKVHAASGFVSFSKAPIWEVQQKYYKATSLAAWESNTVPFQISSNRYVSQYYLSAIYSAFSHKCQTQTQTRRQRICLLEVAAGHGRLAYLCAQGIKEMKQAHYCSSDACSMDGQISEDMRLFYRSNEFLVIGTDMHSGAFYELLLCPWVRELCDDGLLDFGVLAAPTQTYAHAPPQCEANSNAARDRGDVKLLHSGSDLRTVHQNSPFDAIGIIGNYAFDSFPMDLFVQTSSGTLVEIGVREEATKTGKHGPGYHRHSGAVGISSATTVGPPHRMSSGRDPLYVARRLDHSSLQDLDTRYAVPLSRFFGALSEPSGSGGFAGGAFTVPTSGIEILKTIRAIFTSSVWSEAPQFAMLVGDFCLSPEDKAWQIDEFNAYFPVSLDVCIGGTIPGPHEVTDIPWFDPPHCSPTQEIAAYPIVIPVLEFVFEHLFAPTAPLAASSHTAIAGSSFQVSFFVAPPSAVRAIRNSAIPTLNSISRAKCLPFSPSDYFTLLEFVKLAVKMRTKRRPGSVPTPQVAAFPSIDVLFTLLEELDNYDCITFQYIQWELLRQTHQLGGSGGKKRKLVDTVSANTTDSIHKLAEVALRALRLHASTSFMELVATRAMTVEYLFALTHVNLLGSASVEFIINKYLGELFGLSVGGEQSVVSSVSTSTCGVTSHLDALSNVCAHMALTDEFPCVRVCLEAWGPKLFVLKVIIARDAPDSTSGAETSLSFHSIYEAYLFAQSVQTYVRGVSGTLRPLHVFSGLLLHELDGIMSEMSCYRQPASTAPQTNLSQDSLDFGRIVIKRYCGTIALKRCCGRFSRSQSSTGNAMTPHVRIPRGQQGCRRSRLEEKEFYRVWRKIHNKMAYYR